MERSVKTVDRNEFFKEATLKICSSLEIDRALFETFKYVCELIPLDQLILMQPRTEENRMAVLAEASRSGARLLEASFPLSDRALQLLEGQALPGLMIINDPANHPIARHAQGLAPEDFSVILVRLIADQRLVGSVAFRADGRDRYTPDQAELLEPLREPFTVALSNYLRYREAVELKERLADDNRYLRGQLQPTAGPQIVGAEFGLKAVMDAVVQVAPLNSPVLLLGETGTGKELIAGQIHHLSRRREGPLIRVNCGAMPETLVDTELFGHERGAFTGAIATKKGLFERADGGTIFLDEIGELPLGAQVRLLRILQDRRVQRVGGDQSKTLDLRVITATHRNLETLVAEERFRDDLYFRLNVFPIVLPPLRERLADIPLLVSHFVQKKWRDLGLASCPFAEPASLEQLMSYSWPGNVRELENVVERALIRCQGKPLVFEDLHSTSLGHPGKSPDPAPAPRSLDEVVAARIQEALAAAEGRVAGRAGAARMLGIHPSTLRARMRKLGISFGRKARK